MAPGHWALDVAPEPLLDVVGVPAVTTTLAPREPVVKLGARVDLRHCLLPATRCKRERANS